VTLPVPQSFFAEKDRVIKSANEACANRLTTFLRQSKDVAYFIGSGLSRPDYPNWGAHLAGAWVLWRVLRKCTYEHSDERKRYRRIVAARAARCFSGIPRLRIEQIRRLH